jgi:CubicO group peptidase (beta-lactamase class C family)
LLAFGCRGARTTEQAPEASSPPPAIAATVVAAPPASAPPPVTLPSTVQLAAPFTKTKAHGFVAMSATDAKTRAFAPIVSGESVDAERPVLVASFTKLWTAVATLRMVSRGELSLDLTIADALPELAKRPWAKSTVRELLGHVSLVPEFDDKSGYYRKADVDPADPVAALVRWVPPDWTEKRGIYKYRNAELAIVGAILATRAKATEEEVLSREVFAPAKMTHAGLLGRTAPTGLDLAPMGPVRPQNFFTAGAGYASAADLLAFFEALSASDLLDDASKTLLYEGDATRGFASLGCWAYPFARGDGGTTRMLERPGSFGNVRLFTAFFPDEHRAIVAWTGDGIDIPRPRPSPKGLGASIARVAIE